MNRRSFLHRLAAMPLVVAVAELRTGRVSAQSCPSNADILHCTWQYSGQYAGAWYVNVYDRFPGTTGCNGQCRFRYAYYAYYDPGCDCKYN